MPLIIRDDETQALARRLAERTGEPVATAVRRAIEERLQRIENADHTALRAERLNRIATDCAAAPEYGRRSADDILGYDERGLPN